MLLPLPGAALLLLVLSGILNGEWTDSPLGAATRKAETAASKLGLE